MRLLLDEQLPPALAEALRARGHDVVAVAEDPALRGASDAALLDWATTEGRAIATYDVPDFLRLFNARAAVGEPVAGLVLISVRRHPIRGREIGPLLRDLGRLIDENPARAGLAGRAIWL